MKTRIAYEDLTLIPWLVADCVTTKPMDPACFWHNTSGRFIEQIEALRVVMTFEERKEFVNYFDDLCKEAYAVKADWLMKCLRSKTNTGRDTLYIWAGHNLAGFLARKAGIFP